ncbi:ATP12 family chaperone protein [Novosphingopyxis iocasae]|uniref:ATP12 family chaperone protein n=1 Tax=Novosphingopyxis iocasae TaxID=2762729 RepID=UPI0016511A44|nr:ATP12 family protein [Novosphingopyxis iocasae]
MTKRFYKDVAVEVRGGGRTILLDGRPVNTPARKALLLPTDALAEAVAEEWRAQGEVIDPAAMPLTGLANAAIDRIAPGRADFERELSGYGDTDLLYYRAADPEELVQHQAARWDPVLAWARQRFDIDFHLASGVMHQRQPPQTLERLAAALAARDDWALASLARTIPISGSLVLMLAVDEGAITPDEAWQASVLDELWQEQLWGADALAVQAREARGADFAAAWRFRELALTQG